MRPHYAFSLLSLFGGGCGAPDEGVTSAVGSAMPAWSDAATPQPNSVGTGVPPLAGASPGVQGPPPPVVQGDAGPSLCEQRVIRAQSILPEMLIVLDKSASMAAGLRWDPSRLAVQTLVREFDSKIAFGLSMFPGGALGLCDPGVLDVPIKLGNAAVITQRIDSEFPFGITPTAQTLENVLMYMGNRDATLDGPAPVPAYVLLVTDGEPNCPDLGHLDPIQSSVDAVKALREVGVKTFVIGYGLLGLGMAVMDQLAVAGGTEHYYAVESQQQLAAAFHEITKGLVSCTFELSEVPPDPSYVRVVLDGKTIVLNNSDGWVINGRVVTLQGGSCAALRDGMPHQLESQVECKPVLVF